MPPFKRRETNALIYCKSRSVEIGFTNRFLFVRDANNIRATVYWVSKATEFEGFLEAERLKLHEFVAQGLKEQQQNMKVS